MVNAMDVSMNMIAHHVVALERNVAAPRGPNAVWLPAPPKAPAKSAASPLCSMITTIKSPQMTTCNVTSMKYTFQPSDQSLDVVGFDAAAVEDSQTGSAFGSKTCRRLLPQEAVRLGSHFRRRRAARANRPNRLVSKDDTRELRTGQRGYAAAELAREDLLCLAAFPFGEQFAHAKDRHQARRERRFDFSIGALIALSEKLPSFGMRDDDGAASRFNQHRGGNFPGERPFGLPVHILSGDGNRSSLHSFHGSRERRKRRRDDDVAMNATMHERRERRKICARFRLRLVHLPISRNHRSPHRTSSPLFFLCALCVLCVRWS